MTHDDVDNEAPECPICLNSMGLADMIHQACTHCDYNFCYDCLRKFIKSSLPQLDEDGNRTKGCALVCPNCRHDVAQHVHDLVALRKSDLVAALPENDSELTATQLRLKYSRSSDKSESSYGAHGNGMALPSSDEEDFIDVDLFGGLQFAMTTAEQLFVTSLMTSGDPMLLSQACQILSEISVLSREGKTPSMRMSGTPAYGSPQAVSPPTTPTERAARAAGAAAQNFQQNRTRSLQTGRSGAVRPQRRMEEEKERRAQRALAARRNAEYPLPARMPKNATLPVPFTKRGLNFIDDLWDGSVADAFSRIHVGKKGAVSNKLKVIKVGKDNSGVNRIIERSEQNRITGGGSDIHPINRVLIQKINNILGHQGVQKGDVVTHINGERFLGNAEALMDQIKNIKQNKDIITITFNADEGTAEALRVRALL
eukprot:CAMPEP_0113301078 /NCGR_PEP_ID=MMETSP0010_2-20120614/2458_1 /TAXON_ID=216773 ORGANISM="Corethron hystrix, Strain 308" /NCGR_SAMPLE_ID=MMETSP0010_2 /ASSEMBLY_ACC=CAM_ASM_000155 /LENGTH=426 /DNA_ID=CAMNT_0000154643 /DNA_START=70 /DNA_END=1350 /DNA_ORIENTATION=- /assembly_acc=CAM_ASM_000155